MDDQFGTHRLQKPAYTSGLGDWVLSRLGMIVRRVVRPLYLIFLQLVNLLLLLGRALMHRRITASGKLG